MDVCGAACPAPRMPGGGGGARRAAALGMPGWGKEPEPDEVGGSGEVGGGGGSRCAVGGGAGGGLVGAVDQLLAWVGVTGRGGRAGAADWIAADG